MGDFFSYEELSRDEDAFFSYQDLLQTIEWRKKRQQIIKRDNYKCQHCEKEYIEFLGRVPHEKNTWAIYRPVWDFGEVIDFEYLVEKFEKPYFINVHHKYYIIGSLPWQYPDDALITLCEDCHTKVHAKEKTPIYSSTTKLLADKLDFTSCSRCNGKGYFPEYKKIQGGVCFRCGGVCFEELIGATFISNSEIIYIPKEFEVAYIYEPHAKGTAYFLIYVEKLEGNKKIKVPVFGEGDAYGLFVGYRQSFKGLKVTKRPDIDGVMRYWLFIE